MVLYYNVQKVYCDLIKGSLREKKGSVNDYQAVRSYGWVVKVDANGCIDTLCNLSTATEEVVLQEKKIQVYPNPATSNLTFSWDVPIESVGEIIITDNTGRMVYQAQLMPETLNLNINTSTFPTGIYFYQLKTSAEAANFGKFLIENF